MGKRWLPKLSELTSGEISIEFTPVKSIMPRNETPEGIAVEVLGPTFRLCDASAFSNVCFSRFS